MCAIERHVMDAKLKECPFCGSPARLIDHRTIFAVECTSSTCAALVLGDRAPEPDGEMGDAYWAGYQQTAIKRWEARAIAPPVAAGSVDTGRLEILLTAFRNAETWEDRGTAKEAIIANINAWGAQQREALLNPLDARHV